MQSFPSRNISKLYIFIKEFSKIKNTLASVGILNFFLIVLCFAKARGTFYNNVGSSFTKDYQVWRT